MIRFMPCNLQGARIKLSTIDIYTTHYIKTDQTSLTYTKKDQTKKSFLSGTCCDSKNIFRVPSSPTSSIFQVQLITFILNNWIY